MQADGVSLGRWAVLAAGVAVMAVLCLAVILLAGPPTREASRAPTTEGAAQDHKPVRGGAQDDHRDESEAIHPDARMYAKDFDVSLEEADRRLKMQGDTLPTLLERELKKKEPDAYAGLWLRHEPDYGLTVALAGDSEAAVERVRRFVEGTRWEGTVDIKHVEASMIELNAARAEAKRIFNRLGVMHESDTNVFKNRIEFYVANRAQFERKLSASGLELPEHIFIGEGLSTPA